MTMRAGLMAFTKAPGEYVRVIGAVPCFGVNFRANASGSMPLRTSSAEHTAPSETVDCDVRSSTENRSPVLMLMLWAIPRSSFLVSTVNAFPRTIMLNMSLCIWGVVVVCIDVVPAMEHPNAVAIDSDIHLSMHFVMGMKERSALFAR